MSDIEVVQGVRRVLAATLDEIVGESAASRGDSNVVGQWDIRSDGRDSLVSFGIPIGQDDPEGVHFQGAVQESADPEVSVSGRQGYRLGTDSGWTLAAMAPSGEVWAIQKPEQANQSADPRIFMVNSSVTGFVDLSWRWQAVRPLLSKLGYRDSFFEAAELYLARLPDIDEALADKERYSWWRGMVLDW
ncbi:SUKH-4 family immunity protein [Winogradskya humida]|uniref:Uncharacterized protein n=1 Tax=Winogradskya humida TaxID=113566 RepID=A0ABQ4A7L4_9ACTN|nr:SUKH-4 family immunity protein [Actinoplanes humidus]GIE26862.1 hypothetical protein Ahu01nite_099640 [Actinoplanes humidus]